MQRYSGLIKLKTVDHKGAWSLGGCVGGLVTVRCARCVVPIGAHQPETKLLISQQSIGCRTRAVRGQSPEEGPGEEGALHPPPTETLPQSPVLMLSNSIFLSTSWTRFSLRSAPLSDRPLTKF